MTALYYMKLCLFVCLCVIVMYLSASTTKIPRKDFKRGANFKSTTDRGPVASRQLQTTAATNTSTRISSMTKDFIEARKKLTRKKIIKIFLPGIRPSEMKITKSLTALARNKQTRSIPLVDSCALVGNSGILSNSSCGDAIDMADLVLRMNLAPAGGEYARDVGSKTNVTTINGEQSRAIFACAMDYTNTSVDNVTDDCRCLLKLMQRQNNTIIWCIKGFALMKFIKTGLQFYVKYHDLKVLFAFSPASPIGPTGMWMKVRHATTGAALYLAATTFCRRITLYGFYPRYVDPTNRTLRYHYYDNAFVNYSKSAHSFNKEFEVLKSLEDDGHLKIINDCAGRWDKRDYRRLLGV
ncbi:alpha-2,8-sialyltransferase 8B-like [Diadema antillarum]|uniref:alpha-2,8-sialyltransferase 8B-like n=1 Tax=Diadema antillarum TaxID=105358 RepID=UPI003A87C5A5